MTLGKPANHIQRLGAVGKRPFDGEGIQVLAAVRAVGDAPANAMRGDRPGILDPANLVNLVNVHFRKQAAGDPQEMNEVTDLPEQLLFSGRALPQVAHRLHAVGADQVDVAQLAGANAADQLVPVARMPALQSRGDLQVFGGRSLPRLDDSSQARSVRREGFFHKDVHALFDGIFELPGAKSRIAGEHRHVARAKHVNRLPGRIEPDKLPLGRHVHLSSILLAQCLVRPVKPLAKQVGHRDHLDRAMG